jgi:hypothetical protein
LRAELRNWRFKRLNLGAVDLERHSRHLFLSSGSSLLRHKLKEAWDHFFRPAQLNGAIFFLDDLQNISISKSDLALTIRDQFQFFGIEGMNYSVCFSANPDYFAETKALAEPAVRCYTKVYLDPFTLEKTIQYTRSVFGASRNQLGRMRARRDHRERGDQPLFRRRTSRAAPLDCRRLPLLSYKPHRTSMGQSPCHEN